MLRNKDYKNLINLVKLEEYGDALKEFRAIKQKTKYDLKKSKNDIQYKKLATDLINKGDDCLFLGKYDNALAMFKQATEYDPKNDKAWIKKGVALSYLKQYKDALEADKEAIYIEPENVDAWINMGMDLTSLKMYDAARDTFDIALTIEPENGKAWVKKGVALSYLKKYKNAYDAFDRAIEVKPKNEIEKKWVYTRAWAGKGVIFSNLEMYDCALRAFKKSISMEPKNANAWQNKGVAFLNLKKYVQGQEALEQALNLDRKELHAYNNLAEYYLKFGDLKTAICYVENALSIDGQDATSLNLKGRINIDKQNYDTSIECFKKAITLDLRNPFFLLWDSYAKYLKADLEIKSDDKRYQDIILSIIRELEKVDDCIYEESNNYKSLPFWIKNLFVKVLEAINKILTFDNTIEEFTATLLLSVNQMLVKLKSPKVLAYNYYFLGCFYCKIGDYTTAVEYLKKCKSLKSDFTIEKYANETLNIIWCNQIRPSLWSWWLKSPLNSGIKKISFLILVFSLFAILLPTLTSVIIYLAYYSVLKPLFSYQSILDFSTVELLLNFFLSRLTLINWKENATQLALITSIIVFILVSPIVQRFKGSQLEVEVRPPPTFELIPSLIEKKLKDLEKL